MQRKPRFYLPSVPAYVIQRGNSLQPVFFGDEDYSPYLDWLKEGADMHGCVIHANVLMTNHVLLLMRPQTRDSISKTIQFVLASLRYLYQSCIWAEWYAVGRAAQGKRHLQ